MEESPVQDQLSSQQNDQPPMEDQATSPSPPAPLPTNSPIPSSFQLSEAAEIKEAKKVVAEKPAALEMPPPAELVKLKDIEHHEAQAQQPSIATAAALSSISNRLELSTEFLKAAIHAVALEASLESTDALMTAAREVYALGASTASLPPVFIPSIPASEPAALSPKVASPKASPRPPSPRLILSTGAEDKKAEEQEDRRRPTVVAAAAAALGPPPAEEKPTIRASTIQLTKAYESSSSSSSEDDEDRRKLSSTNRSSSSSLAASKRRTARKRRTASYSSTTSSLGQTEIGKKLSRLASQGGLSLSMSQLKMLEVTLPGQLARLSSSACPSLGGTTPRLQELAKPSSKKDQAGVASKYMTKREQKLSKYALLDDAKECTFKPKCHRWSGGEQKGDDDDDDNNNDPDQNNKAKQAFMDRQFSTEQARRKALEKSRRENEYAARVDKKKCPSCGVTQTYDEVLEKKRKCPNCNVDYVYRVQWQKVARKFYQRQDEFAKAEIGTYEKMVVDAETGKLKLTRTEPLTWDEGVADSFFERAAEFEERKALRLKQAEEEQGYHHTSNKKAGKSSRGRRASAWESEGEEDDEGMA